MGNAVDDFGDKTGSGKIFYLAAAADTNDFRGNVASLRSIFFTDFGSGRRLRPAKKIARAGIGKLTGAAADLRLAIFPSANSPPPVVGTATMLSPAGAVGQTVAVAVAVGIKILTAMGNSSDFTRSLG